ncbi:hypothetical protein GF312_11085 [Candidatus Poribacteria bacterium]|nr:hypothetical protein [Candidatus Poribacteria bacterium]
MDTDKIIDILGIVDLSVQQELPPLPENAFESHIYKNNINDSKGDARFRQYNARGWSFQATYLEKSSAGNNYFADDGKHLFIIGEVFARNDASIPAKKLTAEEITKLYGSDGDDFVNKIKGNFCLVMLIEDVDNLCRFRNECRVYNSRFGISPLYYAVENSRFIFSTSMSAVANHLSTEPELDAAGIAELAIFNYPIGRRTYFKKVKMLKPAEYIRIDEENAKSYIYWDVRSLYESTMYSSKEALEKGSEIFYKTVNQLAPSKACVSFTSGFDSRAILSVLDKKQDEYLCYSFGISTSMNVTIPQRMSQKLGFHYCPIVLNGTYERMFDNYAMQALMLSDCLSTLERANYPYAFQHMSDFSSVFLTGIFGSELLRTFQNVGNMVSPGFARMNSAPDMKEELARIIVDPETTLYFSPDTLRNATPELVADVEDTIIDRFGAMSPDRRFYMFLLTEALRKYFGAEVHMERLYGTNRFPFLDDEFVEFLFSAPFAGVYSRTLNPTIKNRYQSQYFYAYIIKKYKPELLKFPTDHGYSPADVISPLSLMLVGPKHLRSRYKRKKTGYREFLTEEWTGKLYRNKLFKEKESSSPAYDRLLTSTMEYDLNTEKWKEQRLDFSKAASLKLYIEEVINNKPMVEIKAINHID